jgi:outer membrane protein OmpA-like peptidoglycan-associated protein
VSRGKCPNRSGCTLAYRGEPIRYSGEARCPECGTSLVRDSGRKGGKPWLLLLLLILVIVGLTTVIALGPGRMILAELQKRVAVKAAQPIANPLPTDEPAAEGGSGIASPSAEQSPEDTVAEIAAAGTPFIPTTLPPLPTPAASAEPSPAIVPPSPVPSPPAVSEAVEAKIEQPQPLTPSQIDSTRADVIKRIEAMPNIAQVEKGRLISKMETCRSMERLLVVQFGNGQSTLSKGSATDLINRFKDPQLREKISDPTLVLVVAGYADPGGRPDLNLRLSDERAENVSRVLKREAKVLNAINSVAMGGTDLLDAQRPDQNRAVEIWAVEP